MKEENHENTNKESSTESQTIEAGNTPIKEEQLLKEKLEELRKRDPFIYQ
jgi:hypothetical protein